MSTPLPLACTLTASEQVERAGFARLLVAEALVDSAVTKTGASLRFRASAEDDLRVLVAAESRCCAFLDFDLRADGDDVRLTVTGPEEARPIILELFGLPA